MLMVLQIYDEALGAWCALNRSLDRAHLTLMRDRWAAAWLATVEIEDAREAVLASG